MNSPLKIDLIFDDPAPVTEANLIVIDKEHIKSFPLKKSGTTIGRTIKSDIVIERGTISSTHCKLEMVDQKWHITDLNSSNGVYLNEKKITPGIKFLIPQNHGLYSFQLGSTPQLFLFLKIDNEAPPATPKISSATTAKTATTTAVPPSPTTTIACPPEIKDEMFETLSKIKVYKDDLQHLNNEINLANQKHSRAMIEFTELTNKNTQLIQSIRALQDEEPMLAHVCKELSEKNFELSAANEKLIEENEHFNQSKNQRKQILDDLENHIKISKDEYDKLVRENSKIQHEVEIIRDLLNELSADEIKLKQKKSSIEEDIFNLETKVHNIEREIAKIEESSRREIDLYREQCDLEINAKKVELEKSLADQKREVDNYVIEANQNVEHLKKEEEAHKKLIYDKALEEAKETIKAEEFAYHERRSIRTNNIVNDIGKMIDAEMERYKAQPIDNELISIIKRNFNLFTINTLLEKESPEANTLRSLYTQAPKEIEVPKGLFTIKQISYIAIGLYLFIGIFPSMITAPRSWISSLGANNQAKEEAYIKAEAEKQRNAFVYRPEKTDEIKDSYVDNLLYTNNYLEGKNEEKFSNAWTLSASEYMIYKLDLKDTTIIKFVGMEAKFIRELQIMAKEIDPKTPEVKIKEMREHENLFKKNLRSIMDDDIKISKFFKYMKEYWVLNHQDESLKKKKVPK